MTFQGEVLEIVDRFTYLGSCISNDASVSDEINARITKARLALSNSRHLWRQKGVSLELKARVYNTTVRPVLLYGCETWLLRAEDLRRLEVFDHRCLRSIAGIGWHNRISNTQVRKRVFGNKGESHSLANLTRVNKLEWLGHVLRTPSHRLARRALFARPHHSWCRAAGGQALTWQREMKTVTKSLGSVGSVRLPGWGPRDPSDLWLHTLSEMASNRNQWRSCCYFLAKLSD